MLLTGMLSCGNTVDGRLCGATLHSGMRPRDKVRQWTCRPIHAGKGCGGVGVVNAPLEALVTEALLQELERRQRDPRLEPPTPDTTAALDELRDCEARLDALASEFAVGTITQGQLVTASEMLRHRIDSLQREIGRRQVAPLVGADGQDVRAQWLNESLEWRRQILAGLAKSIVISPVGRKWVGFNPDRVAITWH